MGHGRQRANRRSRPHHGQFAQDTCHLHAPASEYTSDNHGRDRMWQDPTVQIYVRAAKKTKSRGNERQ